MVLRVFYCPVAGCVVGWVAVCVAGSLSASSNAAFFLPFGRFWELMAGALLNYAWAPNTRFKATYEIAAIAGLSAIVVSVFSYTPNTPFPGFAALLPSLARRRGPRTA